jgi:hypothetical protein
MGSGAKKNREFLIHAQNDREGLEEKPGVVILFEIQVLDAGNGDQGIQFGVVFQGGKLGVSRYFKSCGTEKTAAGLSLVLSPRRRFLLPVQVFLSNRYAGLGTQKFQLFGI